MADEQYVSYRGVFEWKLGKPFPVGKTWLTSVDGPIRWELRTSTITTTAGLESELSFMPAHRDLNEFSGNWLIKGILTFSYGKHLLQVDFTCNQGQPAITFDSTPLKGEEVVLSMHYTELVGMGVVPRPNYNLSTNKTDVCLVVGQHRLHLSKTILAHYSDYFNVMFFGDFTDATKDEIEIKEVEADHFIALLDLCHGSYLMRRTLVEPLLKLADRFIMPIALQKIESFLLVTDCTDFDLDNTRLIQIADQYKFTVLMTQTVSKLTLGEYKKLMKRAFVHSLSRETTVAIMKRMDSLYP